MAPPGLIVEPPGWTLQPFERDLAIREVAGLTGVEARWNGEQLEAPPSISEEIERLLARRLAFASRVGTTPTMQTSLERAIAPGRRKVTSHALHGVHPYKGKFYPQLARSLINAAGIEPGMVVLDPFAGCGTTALEAALMDVTAIGLDANPLAVLVSQTKIDLLAMPAERVTRALEELRGGRVAPMRHPDAEYLERWFPPANHRALLRILARIERLRPLTVRNAAKVVLSSVIRDASLQDPRQIRIYRRRDTDSIPDLDGLFRRGLDRLVEELAATQDVPGFSPAAIARTETTVRLGDARRLHADVRLQGRLVDAVVTSPPYATALPYIDTDRLSLRALGLLRESQTKAEGRLIGNRELTAEEHRALQASLDEADWMPPRLVAVVEAALEAARDPEAGFRRQRTPVLLYRYFLQMRTVLGEIASVLRPGGQAIVVIGDSSFAASDGSRVPVPTATLLAELASSHGMALEDRLTKRLTSFGASSTVHQRNAMGSEEVLFMRRER